MIEIADNISKAEISQLPPVLFGGRVIVIHSLSDLLVLVVAQIVCFQHSNLQLLERPLYR